MVPEMAAIIIPFPLKIRTQSTVVLEDTTADITQSILASDRTTITANGTDEAILTLSLKNKGADGSLQEVTGEASRLTFFVAGPLADSNKYTFTKPQENRSGEYTTRFSGLLSATKLSLGVKINGKDTGMRVLMDLTAGTSMAVSGNSVVGETLTATPDCAYTDITGATNATWQVTTATQKRRIQVRVSN